MHSVTSGNAPDLELVARSLAEIKKRAMRLKRNLALPDFHSEASESGLEFEDAQQLLASVSKLSSLIEQFVANPIFKESRLMDMQLAAKAKANLEGILEMSDRLRQSSEKLRVAAKTQSQ